MQAPQIQAFLEFAATVGSVYAIIFAYLGWKFMAFRKEFFKNSDDIKNLIKKIDEEEQDPPSRLGLEMESDYSPLNHFRTANW